MSAESRTFDELRQRLDQIVDLVSDDALALDDALSLYEEAVGLGLEASNLLEQGVERSNAEFDQADGSTQEPSDQ